MALSFVLPGAVWLNEAPRMCGPCTGKIMGHDHDGVGRGMGLRSGSGSEAWEDQSLKSWGMDLGFQT